ncbi:ABC transporter permease [Micromonospora rifamycinica]|uniref:Nucleoside ABC transporter membrane protein n=1 Tax=Micromonospora rifamycinica TaxID=291594 RepID=A0A1C5HK76_9ACTN|nr:ABC transporter permease [Micromonospora rifamycinica]SCG46267.1 nucleoside ABC transporter membrane protein [Micromonospora rifamycinica]
MATLGIDGTGQRLLRRLNPGPGGWQVGLATVATVGVALGLSALLIAVTGGSPTASTKALYQGSMASPAAWSTSLLYVAPLLLVAVGACVSARSGFFNIGQEGQVLIGALAGAWVGLRLAVPGPLLLVLVLLASVVGAGVWAGLSALMYRFRGVNIVVSTMLMTFLAQQLISFAVNTPWLLQESRLGRGTLSPQSNPVPENARLTSLGEYPNLQLNGGLVLAVVVAVVLALVMARTRWGFRLKMVGLNPAAARHAGVRVGALGGIALAISGALAGLAGALLLTSPVGTNRLQPGMSLNIGWDGLLVALVARNNPLLAIPVAVLFGVLRAGGSFLAATGVPSFLVDVVKALLVLAFVAPPVVIGMLRRRRLADEPAAPTATPPTPTAPTAVPAPTAPADGSAPAGSTAPVPGPRTTAPPPADPGDAGTAGTKDAMEGRLA